MTGPRAATQGRSARPVSRRDAQGRADAIFSGGVRPASFAEPWIARAHAWAGVTTLPRDRATARFRRSREQVFLVGVGRRRAGEEVSGLSRPGVVASALPHAIATRYGRRPFLPAESVPAGSLSAFRFARSLSPIARSGSVSVAKAAGSPDQRRSLAIEPERPSRRSKGVIAEGPTSRRRDETFSPESRARKLGPFQHETLAVRDPARSANFSISAELYAEIERSRPSASRLDYDVRMRLAPFLGFDPWIARVHRGPTAARAARALRAQAFALGQDIFFGDDRYETRTREGMGLLAHELTHVGQQVRTGGVELRFFTPAGGDILEQEAQAVASRVQAHSGHIEAKKGPRKHEDILHSDARAPKPSMTFAMPAPSPRAESMPEPSQTATQEHEAGGKGGKQATPSRGADATAVANRVYDLMREEIRLTRQRGVPRFAP
ncbi:MAG TPA: DUF4157 domain-containing protein [Capsulimonadaceae bacterium]|nr:DUF4157 domain-containing protein [Capsulimonadaceae bacterium]